MARAWHSLEGAVKQVIKRRAQPVCGRRDSAVRCYMAYTTFRWLLLMSCIYKLAMSWAARGIAMFACCCCQPTLRCYATVQSGGDTPQTASNYYMSRAREHCWIDVQYVSCSTASQALRISVAVAADISRGDEARFLK